MHQKPDAQQLAELMQEAYDLGIMPEAVIQGDGLSWDCTKLGQYIQDHQSKPLPDPLMMIGDGDDE